MAVLTWDQVAGYLIAAGFTISNNGPELAAIAYRESRFDTSAHNAGSNNDACSDGCGHGPDCCGFPCESSWGLWQINRCAFPSYSSSELADPASEAAIVWDISEHGANLSPWRGLDEVEDAWLDYAYEAFGANGLGNPITPPAAAYLADMLEMFPQTGSLGVYVCKDIIGTDIYSQHSWGNAVDLAAQGDLLATMAAYAIENSERLKIRTLCFNSQSWTPDGGYGGVCKGDHTTHLHADFLPGCTGVPPCMGGPPENTCGAISASGTADVGGCPCGATLNPVTIAECVTCTLKNALGDVLTPIFDKVFAYLKIAAGGVLIAMGGAVALYSTGVGNSAVMAVATKANPALAAVGLMGRSGSPRTAAKPRREPQAARPAPPPPRGSQAPSQGSEDEWERGKLGGDTVEVNRKTGKVRRPAPSGRGGGPRSKVTSREREGASSGR